MPNTSVSHERPSALDRRVGYLAEAAIVVLLVMELCAQLMTYPPTYSEDPDGYVTYAKYLRDNHAVLPSFPRLPGYPFFLALVTDLSPAPLPDNVWWVQGFLMVALAVAAWALTRRRFGRLPAIVLLGILAAPCYFTRMSVVMLTDMLYTVLILPLMVTSVWWAFRPGSRRSWLWCLPFVLGMFVTQSIRPTTFLLGLMLGPSIVVGYLVARWLRRLSGELGLRLMLARGAAVMLLASISFAAVDTFLDTGARKYNSMVFGYRVVLALPAATDTRADRRIERAKDRFEEVEGQPIETAHFLTYRKFNPWTELRADDVQAVWQSRLLRYPHLYLLSIVQDLRLNHYYLISRFTPLFFELGRTDIFGEKFHPMDGSPSANIFYASGLVIHVMPDAKPTSVNAELSFAAVRFLAVWGFLLLGCWQLLRRCCAPTVTFVVLLLGFAASLSGTNTIDGRYLLPFAVLIYLTEAMGIAWIAQSLLRSWSPAPLPAAPRAKVEHREPALAR
jgi:hypothetical protein